MLDHFIFAHVVVIGCFASSILTVTARTNTNTSLAQHLNTTTRIFDCNQSALLDRGECLQAKMESFYTHNFTRMCPNFGLNMAQWECKGCPWALVSENRSDADLIEPLPSCVVARYARLFSMYTPFVRFTSEYGVFAVILPIICNSLLSLSDVTQSPITPLVWGTPIPEPLYVFLLLCLFTIGIAFSSTAQSYVTVCELDPALSTLEITDLANYFALLTLTLRRAVRLKTGRHPNHLECWTSYRAHAFDEPLWKRIVTELLYVGGPMFVLFSLVMDVLGLWWFVSQKPLNFCLMGYRNYAYGVLQYTKLAMQIFTVTVYSFGPPQTQLWFRLRFIALSGCAVMSHVFFILMNTPLYQHPSASMLIPRIRDESFYNGVSGLAFSYIISLLGLLEPLRIDWESQFELPIESVTTEENSDLKVEI